MQQNQSLDLSLKQGLTLTPQLQQAIKLLNMNSLDLQVEISAMLMQNIMLERKNDSLQERGSVPSHRTSMWSITASGSIRTPVRAATSSSATCRSTCGRG